ncbi:MAG: alpha-glucan family phosphorylase, partial [Candidatus Kapaibacterium sp.]
LFLLDTNIELNEYDPVLRDITDQLYGGTTETRIMQEMLMGIGGMRALRAVGRVPSVLHINEGHAAFCALERIRMMQAESGLTFAEALEVTRSGGCFTTHTPVPAGNEIFTTSLVKQFFADFYPALGLTEQEFLELGRMPGGSDDDGFSMTVLGLKTTTFRNGVSELHGEVAREMWHDLWPHRSHTEVPIRGITNGVHALTWIAKEFGALYSRFLDERWYERAWDDTMWSRVHEIPDDMLWSAHERRRRMLVDRVRDHVRTKALLHMSPQEKISTTDLLNPYALTIGFARRFATYKRSDLLFRDMERLVRLLCDEKRPVQILIAGKAHPRDVAGKEMMHRIIMALKSHGMERRVVFLEDYDMDIAKYLVKGVDVWLNTPRRPYEASGTSGMKAALNGVVHCSVPDGWWAEAFDGTNGFAIGRGEEYANDDEQDMVESESLYHLLESVIIPAFYERTESGVPGRWVEFMKNSIATNAGRFSSARMVRDYVRYFYAPAAELALTMTQERGANARALAAWKTRMERQWSGVRVHAVRLEDAGSVHVGKPMRVRADVELAGIAHDEVRVELCHGVLDARGHIVSPSYHRMQVLATSSSGTTVTYEGEYECSSSGMQGVNVRVMPHHPLIPFSQDIQLMALAHTPE